MRTTGKLAIPALALLLGFPMIGVSSARATTGMQEAAAATNDTQIQADLAKSFGKSRYKNVKVEVQGGVVTLTGSVDLYRDKEDADKKAHHTKNVTAVRNQIEVSSGDNISDQQLQEKLVKAISYDRVGYGTTPFNAISVSVQNGVVTLGGHAYGPVDASSAVGLAGNTPGVKDVVDEINVDPVSPMDDRIRLQVARAVYGFPSLNKYAIDPAKPIRISVQNGNVTLYGVVDNKGDKDAAGIRANGVPGVFKVTNNLQVAGQQQEK